MSQQRRVSLQHVATEAGVSRQTVSLALRDHPKLPLHTRQRIQEIARRLGYCANPIVSTVMASARAPAGAHFMGTLAFVTSHKTRDGWRLPVFEKMFEGAAKRAASLGYKLEAFWLKEPGMTARRFHTILHTRAIGGLIIAPVPTAGGHLSLDWSQFAAVALGYSLYRPNLDRVVSHTYHAMLLALRQLKRLGYRRVGLVLDETVNKRTDQNLMAGYYVFQRSLRPSDRVPILVVKRLNASHFARWFERCRPEAVISDDRQALDWLHTLRQSVPSQVGFVTLDRRGPLRHAAGIDLRPELLGEGAVDLLTAKLHRHERGIPPTPKVVLIECQWVDGDTLRVMPRSQS